MAELHFTLVALEKRVFTFSQSEWRLNQNTINAVRRLRYPCTTSTQRTGACVCAGGGRDKRGCDRLKRTRHGRCLARPLVDRLRTVDYNAERVLASMESGLGRAGP